MTTLPVMSGTLPITDIIAVRATSGRVSVPSAQFVSLEHISGMPAAGQTGGYSITKLRILDALLDRLAVLKGERPSAQTEGLSGEGLDTTIENLQKNLRDALKNVSSTPFAAALGAGADIGGQLFSFLA